MVEVRQHAGQGSVSITVIPNRSLSWRANMKVWLFFCLLLSLIAGVFASLGLWLVLPFAGLELLALGLGLYLTSLKLCQLEGIEIDSLRVIVTRGRFKAKICGEFNRANTRLEVQEAPLKEISSLSIRAHNNKIAVGALLGAAEKKQLLQRLQDYLPVDRLHQQEKRERVL